MKRFLITLLIAMPAFAARDGEPEADKRIRESANVLGEILNAGDRAIPKDMLRKAQCVGIVPNLKRAGFIVGAKYGKGVVTCRTASGWSGPAAVRIEGGSFGFQIGAGETDLIFIVLNRAGMAHLNRDRFTIGGEASAMAGPIGRSAAAATDPSMRAEILAYSRSRGIFAGVSLEGATLRPDHGDNEQVYGHPVRQKQVLEGVEKVPLVATELCSMLNHWAARPRVRKA